MNPHTYTYDFSCEQGGRPWIDHLGVNYASLHSLCLAPEDVLFDLLDVAMAVYTADRLSKRQHLRKLDPEEIVRGRYFNLRIPVRIPNLWQNSDVLDSLLTTLNSLTYDIWSIDFITRSSPFVIQDSVLKKPFVHPYVALFSGGLDSLAGFVIEAASRPELTPTLAVGFTNNRQRRLQLDLLQDLQVGHFQSPRFVHFKHSLDEDSNIKVPESSQEKSQRTRGFLFLAFGAVTAALSGSSELSVFENGVGAINLPYTRASGGADHTRSMHPTHLLNMSRFLSKLFDTPFYIKNPFQWYTKGAMVAEVKQLGVIDLAVQTVSCDGFPLRKHTRQCGRCTSCLLRRVAIFAGGLIESEQALPNEYLHDVLSLPADSSGDTLVPLRFMLAQVERLRAALASPTPAPSLLREFPELYEVRTSLSVLENLSLLEVDLKLEALYRTYVSEWDWFSLQLPQSGFERSEHI